jgi:hypothetical protein
MALDAANVRVGITGGVRSAPVGTTAPTNPTDAYGAGWVEYGYVGEDGVEETFTAESTDIRAWQNGVLVRTVNSKTDATFKFMVIETNKNILADFRPGSTVSTSGGVTTTTVKPINPNPRAFALDVIDGSYNTRKIIPRGEIVDRGPITYKTDEAIGYEITIKAYPASDGTLYVEYSNDPAVAVS